VQAVASSNGRDGAVLRGAASAIGASVLVVYLRWFVLTQASPMDASTLRRESRRDNAL